MHYHRWHSFVQVTDAELDLDNLQLSQLGTSSALHVSAGLEALLISGSCIDVAATSNAGLHPRGVQLALNSQAEPHVQDTLVMSNLGYFQLKAGPGVRQRAADQPVAT